MKRVVVTGGSGKAGRAVVVDLLEHGYEVLNIDIAPSGLLTGAFLRVDLMNLGAVVEALHGSDAVVHLAAIPAPRLQTESVTFERNIITTYNVFQAAALLGILRVVSASSETTLGLPFDRVTPAYAPIDEDHLLYPESSYALSKVLSEEMARQFARWHAMTIISLRFSNVIEPHDYAKFPEYWRDTALRKWNLWGYVDSRDVAQSCRLALEANLDGARSYIIAANDTVMNRPSAQLMAEVFPGVPLRAMTNDFATLLSIHAARRELKYTPRHSWREAV